VSSPRGPGLRQENTNAYLALPLATRGLSPCDSPSSIAARICLLLAVLLVLASSARAQLQQPFVYTTGGAIATRNDATGVLAPTSASPLAVLGSPAVLDAKGRFLFAGGNNSIHMYQVDSVTGSYTEVPGSPFASANTNSPALIATEPTGAYLAVVNSIGLNAGESSVESFQINAAAGALVPVSGSFLELVSTPIGTAANPAAGTFTVTDNAPGSPQSVALTGTGLGAPPPSTDA
jgi:hypothetical protein